MLGGGGFFPVKVQHLSGLLLSRFESQLESNHSKRAIGDSSVLLQARILRQMSRSYRESIALGCEC